MKILLTIAAIKYTLIAVVLLLGWLGIKTGLGHYLMAAADAVDADRVISRLWNASWIASWREQHSAVPRLRSLVKKRKRRE